MDIKKIKKYCEIKGHNLNDDGYITVNYHNTLLTYKLIENFKSYGTLLKLFPDEKTFICFSDKKIKFNKNKYFARSEEHKRDDMYIYILYRLLDFDGNLLIPRKKIKCIHCNHPIENHAATDQRCPIGKSRIGYTFPPPNCGKKFTPKK